MQQSMPLSAADDQLLEAELEKLFALQDKPFAREKKTILVRELLGTGMPLKALLSGIRSLINDDLASIKFATICAAARRFIDPGPSRGCQDCSDGLIVTKDADGTQFALSCRCEEGSARRRGLGLTKWNGQATQFERGRLLTRADFA